MKAEIKISRRMVEAVKKDACFSCGRQSYEPCPRATDGLCGREFHGGSRKKTAPTIILPIVRAIT